MKKRATIIAVLGDQIATPRAYRLAEKVGRLLAKAGAVLVCGGLKGVMKAAAKGAKAEGGLTMAILPSMYHSEANQYIDIALPTGLGYARNELVVKCAHAVIAVGGKAFTLSEIGAALGYGIPIIGLETWHFVRDDGWTERGMLYALTPEEAVRTALKLAKRKKVLRNR